MKLEYWILGVMIFLFVGIMASIIDDPNYIAQQKTEVKLESSTSLLVPVPGFEDIPEMIVLDESEPKDLTIDVDDSSASEPSIDELPKEPEALPKPRPESMPQTIVVSPALGSSAPGCDQSSLGCYIPNIVSISIGEEIIWDNTDTGVHTFTSGDLKENPNNTGNVFDSGFISPGKTFSHTFDTAGTYPYFCQIHPWMTGTVQVS